MTAAGQTMRADARKNFEELIRVAREHLSRGGVSTSLEAIAQEAGVGVGTLYRHFPNRDHLIFAALNAQGKEVRAASHQIRSATAEGERLEKWLQVVEDYLSTYHGLPDSVAQALECGEESPLVITCQEIVAITDEFLADSRRYGSTRSGVTGQGLFEAMLMVAWLGAQMPDHRRGLGEVREIIRKGYQNG